MMKSMIAAALVLASGAVLADRVSHTEYPNANRAHVYNNHVAIDADLAEGSSLFALGLVPGMQTPGCRRQVMPFRLNILTGRHIDVYGLDIGGVGNLVTHDFGGLQIATLFNLIGESSGGVQIAGVLNKCQGNMDGAQFGLVNCREKGRGLQVGLINYGNVFNGLQIGALNVIRASTCPVMPVINFAF